MITRCWSPLVIYRCITMFWRITIHILIYFSFLAAFPVNNTFVHSSPTELSTLSDVQIIISGDMQYQFGVFSMLKVSSRCLAVLNNRLPCVKHRIVLCTDGSMGSFWDTKLLIFVVYCEGSDTWWNHVRLAWNHWNHTLNWNQKSLSSVLNFVKLRIFSVFFISRDAYTALRMSRLL